MFPNVRKAHPRHFSLTRFNSLLQNKPLEQKAGVIITNQSLVLQKIDRKLSGSFTCQGVNAIGKGSSQEVFLDVKCEYSTRVFFPRICNKCPFKAARRSKATRDSRTSARDGTGAADGQLKFHFQFVASDKQMGWDRERM